MAGNFHFSASSHAHLGAIMTQMRFLNYSHHITELTFGDSFPGMSNPLNGANRYIDTSGKLGTFKYFLKLVPTTYSKNGGKPISTNQYSVTEYYSENLFPESGQSSAVFFVYDLSPVSVTVKQNRRSLTHFLVQICAVVGGVFAVTGMMDKFIEAIAKMRRGDLSMPI